jgi:hypothetical protein
VALRTPTWKLHFGLRRCGFPRVASGVVFALVACGGVDEGLLDPRPTLEAGVAAEGGARPDAHTPDSASPPAISGSGGIDAPEDRPDAASDAAGTGGVSANPGGACVPNPDPSDEVCTQICVEQCNGQDDDCDLQVDEDEAKTSCVFDHATGRCVGGACVVVACDDGFRDCDGDANTGCEASLDDVATCGSCDNPCAFPNAVAACVAHACVLDRCKLGWDDCDGDGASCEMPLNTLTDCGSCGVVCGGLANAIATCASGVCAPMQCTGNFGDCNGDPRDGCELELNTLSDCGTCGKACALGGGGDDCATGVCLSTGCSAGFADCDGDPSDGCESLNAAAHCGGCGMPCDDALPNVLSATCNAMTCQVTCEPGFADCNGGATNGCETALGSSQHCADCGDACALDHAVTECAGSCQFVRCADGWDDCDGNLANGCEQSLNEDEDCGSCDNDCTMTGDPICSGGVCGDVSCPAGRADCNQDGLPCEIDLVIDEANCGACGFSCQFAAVPEPHAAAGLQCQAGACVALCDATYDDCDGDYANGCEASLRTVLDCAACGMGCAIANATATCATGSCRVATCNTDWDDCDTDQKTCETPLNTTNDCGACDAVCDLMNAVESCGGSAGSRSCQIAACDASYYKDCDTLVATGCEADTRTNTANCAVCGNNCAAKPNVATAHCAASACVVDTCNTGYGDCTLAEGCETPVNTVQNCGACGNNCSVVLPNTATTQCVSLACQVGTCDAGWADCTSAAGCETNVFSTASCGGCPNMGTNQPCEMLPHVQASSCAAGTCTIDGCEPGFENCNGITADGCELQPAVDGVCCDPASDVDQDGLTECDELRDSSPWTDPVVFNGVRVRQANQCNATGACASNDTLAEVNTCMAVAIQQTLNQYAGWDWNNPADNICDAGYGFAPNWTSCDATWQADWTGYVYLATSGEHCFGVTGSATGGCSSLFVNEQTVGLQNGGTLCLTLPAGVYPVRWHHSMVVASSASMHVNYCFGGGASCTPATALPSAMLRVNSPCQSCDDGDPCTLGTCNLNGACAYSGAPAGTTCADDGNLCTADLCSGTACTHPAGNNGAPCADDGNSCTSDVCGGGVCTHPSVGNGTVCNDGQYCTINDNCQSGTCSSGGARNCADGLTCTADTCNEASDACQNPLSPSYCLIGGTCVAEGANDPANDCKSCQSGASTTAYTNKSNGSVCAADAYTCTSDTCSSGTCTHPVTTGCLIGGACIAQGANNPANDCQSCQSATSTTSYTNKTNGTACAADAYACTSDTCTSGACTHPVTTGCLIAGACVASGANDPANECKSCQPGTSTTTYTNKTNGTACTADAYACTSDTCSSGTCSHPVASGCLISGACVAEGTNDPANECKACQNAANTTAYSNKSNGTACTADAYTCTSDTCSTGTCTHPVTTGCLIAGACIASGANDPANDCKSCQPATSTTVYSNKTNGTACAADAYSCTSDTCSSGNCAHPVTTGCLIAGACIASGANDPASECKSCQPATSTTVYTNKTNGTACTNDGMSCTSDVCTTGACTHPPIDTDGDGSNDCVDGCPSDGTKTAPGACGCGTPDTDTDGDGTPNCVDGCPLNPFTAAPPCESCKALTVQESFVDASLTNFPVLVRLTSDAGLQLQARTDGQDIFFTDAAGTTLDHELETYASGTGALVAWVRVPSVSGSVNTEVTMHYGDGTVHAENPGGTWESGFGAVWHLQENPAAASSLQDSSGNARHQISGGSGTSYALSPSIDAASLIGNGTLLNQNDEWVSFGNVFGGTGSVITISAWWRTPSSFAAQYNPLVTKGIDANSNLVLSGGATAGKIHARARNAGATHAESTSATLTTSAWNHLAMVYDGAGAANADRLKIYRNGVAAATTYTGTIPATYNSGTNPLRLGHFQWSSGYGTNGTLDEVHISTSARPAAWLKAEYENQRSGSTFVSVGSAGLCVDNCPSDPLKTGPGVCGCGLPDSDTDGDGFQDCIETCDADPLKQDPGLCGCGAVDDPTDADADGSANCVDACDYDGTRTVGPCLAGYRKPLTIASGKVTATVTDFPVLVRLTGDADLMARASASGADALFKDGAGVLLAFEREYWNQSSGDLRAWVKVPSIPSGSATTVYLHYGDGTTVDRSDKPGTWSNGFEAVWHLEEAPSSGTAVKDSSGNNHTSTAITGLTGPDLVAGTIGNGIDFDGSNDYVNFGSIAATNSGTVLSVSAWVRHTALSSWDAIVQQGNGNTQGWWLGVHSPADDMACGLMNGSSADWAWTSGLAPTTGAFRHWAMTYNDASSPRLKGYYDGTLRTLTYDTSCCAGGWNANNGNVLIGCDPGDLTNWCTNGVIDEVRVSTVERSAAWVKAEYDSQVSGATFVAVGAEQVL